MVDIPKDITAPAYKAPYDYPAEVSLRSYAPAEKGHSGQIRKAVELLLRAKSRWFMPVEASFRVMPALR